MAGASRRENESTQTHRNELRKTNFGEPNFDKKKERINFITKINIFFPIHPPFLPSRLEDRFDSIISMMTN